MAAHQRRRLGTRTVSAASVSMPWARRAATARAGSQRPMSSVIAGCGVGSVRRTSIARSATLPCATRADAGISNNAARSSRPRSRASKASRRRMRPSTAREDWPRALSSPRYCATACRELRPACQARSAARDAASGSAVEASVGAVSIPVLADDVELGRVRRDFMGASLAQRTGYYDKNTYLNSVAIGSGIRHMA
ncbi:exported hypothetical protein [Cupriavidus taiwanensis]|uniref:Uncharacterized protein n=1 Tax=Cupriavidus taiwanensis TaxID=164546 RepID=A0A375CJR6_9BURK|nr:exported hypothetical protein [Cupriavidus taiwanensis]